MKRSKKMLVLLLALVLCAGGYFGVSYFTQKNARTETTGQFAVLEGEVTAFGWTGEEGEITFVKEGENWVSPENNTYPFDQQAVQALADQLGGLTAVRKLEGETELSTYGLSEPSFTVDVTIGGKNIQLLQGAENTIIEAFYLKTSDSAVIYTIETPLTEIFSVKLIDLVISDTLPEITAYDRICIQGENINLDASVMDPAEIGFYSDAYSWFATEYEGMPVALSTNTMEDLMTDLARIEWVGYASYHAEEADLEAYGLLNPALTIEIFNEGEIVYALEVGAKDVATGDYYARLPESELVYLVADTSVTDFFSINEDYYRANEVFNIDMSRVSSFDITIKGGNHQVSVADGVYTMDGAYELIPSEFVSCITRLTQTASSLWTTQDVTDTALVLSITFHTDIPGYESVTLGVYEYSAKYYAVDLFGFRRMLINATNVDDMVRVFQYLEKTPVAQ